MQLREDLAFSVSCKVHFIDKEKHRNVVSLQQLPKGLGVALHPIGAADDQNGIVQHLQRALHLGRKIHMPGGIQKGDTAAFDGQDRLLGKDGDPPLFLQGVGVQKRILMVDPTDAADGAGLIQQSLRQSGLAGVYMG